MGLEPPMKNGWKHGHVWTPVFETISNTALFEHPCLKWLQKRMQIFLICILIKQQQHVAINNFINHTFYETNLEPKLFNANVECNGTVLKEPKTEKALQSNVFARNWQTAR